MYSFQGYDEFTCTLLKGISDGNFSTLAALLVLMISVKVDPISQSINKQFCLDHFGRIQLQNFL